MARIYISTQSGDRHLELAKLEEDSVKIETVWSEGSKYLFDGHLHPLHTLMRRL